jgi:hypothetical protein
VARLSTEVTYILRPGGLNNRIRRLLGFNFSFARFYFSARGVVSPIDSGVWIGWVGIGGPAFSHTSVKDFLNDDNHLFKDFFYSLLLLSAFHSMF